jgi:hypothetical protein
MPDRRLRRVQVTDELLFDGTGYCPPAVAQQCPNVLTNNVMKRRSNVLPRRPQTSRGDVSPLKVRADRRRRRP